MSKVRKNLKSAKKAPKTNHARRAKQAQDQQEPFSHQVCQRIRKMRKKRNWTLEQLAEISGVSRSMLSQIERNSANPTLSVTHRISQAFGMSLGDLVEPAEQKSKIEVTRAKDPLSLFLEDDHVRIRTLSPLHTEKELEFYELQLKPGGVIVSAPHFDGTREFLTVEKGRIQITSGKETALLQKGDSAHYPADVPHKIENVGRTEAVAFLVDIFKGRTAGRA